jgi:hypothetical protein
LLRTPIGLLLPPLLLLLLLLPVSLLLLLVSLLLLLVSPTSRFWTQTVTLQRWWGVSVGAWHAFYTTSAMPRHQQPTA